MSLQTMLGAEATKVAEHIPKKNPPKDARKETHSTTPAKIGSLFLLIDVQNQWRSSRKEELIAGITRGENVEGTREETWKEQEKKRRPIFSTIRTRTRMTNHSTVSNQGDTAT